MKKKILQIVLIAFSVFFGYKMYESVNAPIKFKEIKIQRYKKVIENLKIIRDSQEAYKTVIGEYAPNFETLVRFIDTAKFTITQQRDTSWMEYNKAYRIDMMKQGVVIDTLGYASIKDSLFGDSDAYKQMMIVPGTENEKFIMKSGKIAKAGYNIPVFEAKIAKEVVLKDQPKDLVIQEKEVVGVDDIDGTNIVVGSLNEVSVTGNWPSLYDSKK